MNHKQLLIPLILTLLLITPVFAGYLDNWWRWLHVPSEYAKAPDLLYFLMLPFLAIWAITWGLLTKIKMFENTRINMLLALIFATALMYYGWMFKVVHFLLSFGSVVAFIAFIVVFIVGIKLYSEGKIKGDWKGSALKELRQKEKELKEKRRLLKDYQGDLRGASKETRDKLTPTIDDLKNEIKELEQRIDTLRGTVETDK